MTGDALTPPIPKHSPHRDRPLIRVKPKEGKRARFGAPWLFSNEIAMTPETKGLEPGALVDVVGDDGHEFGVGLFNPKSLIAVRLFGEARNGAIGKDFFLRRLRRASAIRESRLPRLYYRLVNAEGDLLPGLIVDRFGDAVTVQIGAAGMEGLLDPLLAALDEAIAPQTVILRADAPTRALEGLESYVRTHKGAAGRITVEENGIGYFADLAEGQKTGWYYDQRENRAFVAELARGRSVLDCYCYCGGFALPAAKAGAREVMGIDSSAPALALAGEAAEVNGLSCTFVKADVLAKLAELASANQRFDIVVADPPPFVKARKDLEVGARAYRKLATAAAKCVAADGFLLLASCSHAIPIDRFAFECAQGISRAGRSARLIRSAGAGFDHPVHPMLPESAYLKALVYALD
jgi:23S rRNA (cytosine1962-C5)-methyltransferase